MHSGCQSPGKGPRGMPFRDVAFPNFIKLADKPRKNSKESVSFMEVTVILNGYQNIHKPSLFCLTPSRRYIISALPPLSILFVCFSHDYGILFRFVFQCRLGKCIKCISIENHLNRIIQLQGGVTIRTFQVHVKVSPQKAFVSVSRMRGGCCESFCLQ